MLFAIPSKSRPGPSKTKSFLPSGKLFIPESEYKDYRLTYDGKDLVAVPNDIRGITRTRNWILKNCGEREVIFVDDGLNKVGYLIDKEPNGRKFEEIKSESVVRRECEKLFGLTEELDYKIFGVKTESSNRSQHDEKPFLFLTYVTASFMGIINDGEYYFDERYTLKEDYEISLRHIVEKGGILGARYFTWENKHWGRNGGCGDYRTNAEESKCINMLINQYPKFVREVKRSNNSFSVELQF